MSGKLCTTPVVHEKGKKLMPQPNSERKYPSDADKRIRVKPDLYFRLAQVQGYWQPHRDEYFSFSDTVALLADFYSQFYEKCKEDFKK